LAVVPHEPVIVWYGAHTGVWTTALVATCGTIAASWVDHAVFAPFIWRLDWQRLSAGGLVAWIRSRFARAPFAVIALSGLTPLPFFPFKALAFAARYPRGRYLAAVGIGRFPRYVVMAWFGHVIQVPPWALAAGFALLIAPTARRLLWKRHNAN
jgi:membrane protein YqaA with SNARE-associated domain